MLEAQRCWYCHKHNTLGGTQSVESQVGQQERPAEYFLLVDFSKLDDVLTLCHSGHVFTFIGKAHVRYLGNDTNITYYVDIRICYTDDFSCI